MSVARILKVAVLIIVVALIGVVLYLSFADLSKFRPKIEQAVTDATGRPFAINGTLEIDALPSPSVVVEDATLGNAEWGSEPVMVRLGHLSAEIGLWSLLFGPIDVNTLHVRDVNVLLETNEDGTSNTEMGAPSEEPEPAQDGGSADPGLPVIIHFAEIRNVNVVSRAPDTDDQTVTIAELVIEPNEANNLGLTGSGSVLGLALGLGGEIGPLEKLEGLDDVDYRLDGNLGALAFNVEGRTEDLASFDGTAIKAGLATETLEELLEAVGAESPLSGPMKLDAEYNKSEEQRQLATKIALSDVAITADNVLIEDRLSLDVSVATLDKLGELLEVAGLPPQELKANGQLTMATATIDINELLVTVGSAEARMQGALARGDGESRIDIDAKGSSLAEFRETLPEIPFTLKTTALMSPEKLSVDPLAATFGQSDLSGNVSVVNGTPSEIDVRLQSQLLDLTPFYEKNVEREEAEMEAEQAEPPDEGAESKYVFTEEPLALEALRENDVDLELSIARLVRDTLELMDIKTVVGLHDGKLDVKQSLATQGSGTSESEITLNAANDVADLDMLATLKGLKLNLSSGEGASIDVIPATDLTLDIKAAGATPRAMASSAQGRFIITQGPGRVENKMVGRFSGDLFSQLFGAMNPMAAEEQYSNWECSVIGIEFVDGLGEFKGMLLQGEKLQIVGGGEIDLNTEKLNIEFNTKPREGVGVSADMFVTPFISLTGTLASPRVGLNAKGVLLSGGAAVLTGGLSFLFKGLGDRASSGDMCAETLAEVGAIGEAAPSTEATPTQE